MEDIEWEYKIERTPTVDPFTGEILSDEYLTHLRNESEVKQPLYLSKVTSKKDLQDYFKEESMYKVYWTNWAMEYLSRQAPDAIKDIVNLSSAIIARNYLFESKKDLCDILDVSAKHLSDRLKKLVKFNLIRMIEHSGKKTSLLIEINPLYVWKGYVQNNAKDFQDNIQYGSNYRFSIVHKVACSRWLEKVPLKGE